MRAFPAAAGNFEARRDDTGAAQVRSDLVAPMRQMAQRIEPRSRKVSDTLKLAADRIDALSASVPVDPPPELEHQDNIEQPASTPDRAKA